MRTDETRTVEKYPHGILLKNNTKNESAYIVHIYIKETIHIHIYIYINNCYRYIMYIYVNA